MDDQDLILDDKVAEDVAAQYASDDTATEDDVDAIIDALHAEVEEDTDE